MSGNMHNSGNNSMSKLKHFASLAISACIVSSNVLLFLAPAKASQNYQRRDGIAGEIKYVQICNNDHNWYGKAVMEASDEGSTPSLVWVNIKLNEQYRTVVLGVWVPYGKPDSGYNWRALGNKVNFSLGSDRRFYEIKSWSFWGAELDPRYEVLIGNIVETRDGKTIYDLGGIINLGTIPHGGCKTYDDGRLY